ncbi:hypothetical protein NOR_04357 [Metarhizium rileyi]|uniref:Uncharacterized protein n=1 Tax=Metarhizium rileyi (strain RCEF 4871) TaxID=1649241 RepID=A0A167EEG7_METRR|nr:hypothetical protein NOR_04357 [Metarhizium rileyi RCEF 4871]
MVSASSTRKSTTRKSRSPAKDRRSATRTQNAEASLMSSSAASSPSKTETPRTARYSHHLPTDQQRKGNGRVAGRNLIMWNRPRMAEKLLLHIHYECSRHKLQLPWDAIAHRFHPGSSGAAIIQHINRLRREVLAEGHLVPPLTQRTSTTPSDPNVRGYVRQDTQGDDFESTRPVYFSERLDDPKFSIPGDFSFPEEELMDQVFPGTPTVASEEGDYRQDSPTPMGRTSSKSSDGSADSYEAFAPQFVTPTEVLRKTRFPSPFYSEHIDYKIETEPSNGHYPSHGLESGASSFEGTASPNEPVETNTPATALGHFALPSVPEHMHYGHRFAAVQGFPHPFMYPMATPPKMHSPAYSFDHPDCFTTSFHMGMPLAMVGSYNPNITLDPSFMKHGTGQPAPVADNTKEGVLQAEPAIAHGARIRDPFAGLANADMTETADVSTSLAALPGPATNQANV